MISVVVPVLNEAAQIESLLLDLQTFRHAGHELIVVDGGSSDLSVTLAEPWVDRIVHSDRGRALQMNAGAQVAQGDLLLFQHVDTRLPASALECLQGLAGRDVWGRFDVQLTRGHWMFPVIARFMNWRSRLTGIATGDQSIFVARGLFERTAGFPGQPLMEDIELTARLRKVMPPICLRDRVVTSSRRWQQKGVWRTIFLMWRLRLAYFLGVSPERLVEIYYPARKD